MGLDYYDVSIFETLPGLYEEVAAGAQERVRPRGRALRTAVAACFRLVDWRRSRRQSLRHAGRHAPGDSRGARTAARVLRPAAAAGHRPAHHLGAAAPRQRGAAGAAEATSKQSCTPAPGLRDALRVRNLSPLSGLRARAHPAHRGQGGRRSGQAGVRPDWPFRLLLCRRFSSGPERRAPLAGRATRASALPRP